MKNWIRLPTCNRLRRQGNGELGEEGDCRPAQDASETAAVESHRWRVERQISTLASGTSGCTSEYQTQAQWSFQSRQVTIII